MTPAMRREYGLIDTHAQEQDAPTNYTRIKSGKQQGNRNTKGKAKSSRLGTQPTPISSGTKFSSLALQQIPTWDSLPKCTYTNPGNSNLPPSFMEHLQRCENASHPVGPDHCQLPLFFDFRWLNHLRCFFCETHTVLVPGERIWTHISRRHPSGDRWRNINRSVIFTQFLGHVKQCYPTIVNQTSEALMVLPRSLPAPLPSIMPMHRYKCSFEGCDHWSAANKSKGADNMELKRHVKTHNLQGRQYTSAISIESQWTQRVPVDMAERTTLCSIVFVVPYTPAPADAVFPISTPIGAVGPAEKWAKDLGWDDELKYIAGVLHVTANKARERLQTLVELPAHDKVLQASSDVQKNIETGLIKLHKLSLIYFADAVFWIGQKHTPFRLLFGNEGLAFYSGF